MGKAVALEDGTRYFWLNVMFHEHLATAVGNPTLKRAIDGLGATVLRVRILSMRQQLHRQRSLEDHHRLLTAINEGDGDLAAAISRSLVRNGLMRLERGA